MYHTQSTSQITIDDKLTKQLVGRIYAEMDLSKFRYEMLTYENDLQKLLRNKYFVTFNFYGNNSLLVFTKVQNKFYSFTVDRQTLSYNFSKIDYSKVKLKLVNLSLDDQIYNGTIFEGILIKGNDNKDDTYVISDVYKFCGKDMSKDKINIKFLNVVEYLRSNYDKDLVSNNLQLEVNTLFPLDKFDNFVDKVMKKSTKFKYRGICFYPEVSETKLIFNLQQSNSDNQSNFNNKSNENKYVKLNTQPRNNDMEYKNIHKEREQERENKSDIEQKDRSDKKYRYFNDSNTDIFGIFDMKTTGKPDVYKLYAVEKEIIDKKTLLRKVYVGIAHIKGINMSHSIKNLFEDKKSLLMKCKFNNDTSKWEPIEEEKTIKIPSLIEDIESKLVMMEVSDDE